MVRRTVNLNDKKITIIGTAHVSEESVQEVKDSIETEKPDFIGVELDQDRLDSLKDKEGWKDIDIKEAVRDGKGSILALNLLMSIYQRKIGIQEGVDPGAEMLEAVEIAEEKDIEYDVIDQEISVTLQKLRDQIGILDKIKLLASIIFEKTDIEVDELKESNMLSEIVEELEEEFPELKRILLDERNRYMADKLKERDFENGLVFVGAAHVDGLVEELESQEEREEYTVDKGLPWFQAVRYGLPVAIIGMLGYSFLNLGFGTGARATSFWILANGIAAMIGAIIARSHPATWIVSFISAPLTSLYPALGAGMVAGYFEAKFYPPTVGELEEIVHVEEYSELWGNQVGRILLTFILVSIGSAIATFVGAGYIASILSAA